MKRPSEEDKIYYNVTIDHDPQHKEHYFNLGSKAETEIRLKEPLIENPEDYMLAISKYKIDTNSLPLFIPELQQPQLVENLEKGILTTDYQVKLDFNMNIDIFTRDKIIEKKDGKDVETYENLNFIKTVIFNDAYAKNIPYRFGTTRNINYLNYAKNENNVDKTRVYVDNLHEQAFCYNHNKLFFGINEAIVDLLEIFDKEYISFLKTNIDNNITFLPFFGENKKYGYYFQETENILQLRFSVIFGELYEKTYFNKYKYIDIKETTQKISENKTSTKQYYLKFELYNMYIKFSPNLLKYLGFNHVEIEENGWWKYKLLSNYNTDKINYFSAKTIIKNLTFSDFVNFLYVNFDKNYLTNWNPIKAIIIGSDTLPVTEEYLPISYKDGFLTHYKTPIYEKALKDLGIEKTEIRDIFKKNGQRILDIFYPMSTTPGDIRTSIIFSRENMEEGQTITLTEGAPIQNFNIWVKWLDVYGNLYDLYLWPGCAVDIRFCFIKKHASKDDIAEGFGAILDALPQKKPTKEKRSNGKPDGIVLEGADNYGFVHF